MSGVVDLFGGRLYSIVLTLYCVISTVKIRPDIVFPHCLLFLGLCSTNMASMMYVQQILFILNKLNVFFLYRVTTTLFFQIPFQSYSVQKTHPRSPKIRQMLVFCVNLSLKVECVIDIWLSYTLKFLVLL